MSNEKQIKKRFSSNDEDISGIMEFVHDFLESCFTSIKCKKQIELAVEEMATNIIHYAYESGKGPIDIELTQEDPEHLLVTMIDWGTKFDPTMIMPKEPLPDKIEEIEEGGLGIYLAEQVMDEIRYERFGTENHLFMRKHF